MQYAGGAYETRVKFAAVSGGTIAEAVYRTYTAGEPNAFASTTEYSGAGSTRYGYAAANTAGSKLDAKCRFFNDDDEGSYYSDLLTVDPMAIDNNAPSAPTLSATVTNPGSGSTWHVAVSAKILAMNAVKLKIQRSTGPSIWTDIATGEVRPEVELTGSFDVIDSSGNPPSVTLRAYAYSSNGTESPAATYSS